MKKPIPCRIHVGNWHLDGDAKDKIRIEVENATNGHMLFEVRMTVDQFGEAVTGSRGTGTVIKFSPAKKKASRRT